MTTAARLDPSAARPVARPFLPARFALFAALAVVVNAVIFLTVSVAGASMVVTQSSEMPLTPVIVVIATAAPLVLAGVVTWFLARRWPIIRTIAAWAGLAVAVLSAPSPLMVSADLATGITLGVMHLVAGAAWFIGVRKPAARV
jgi:hypothetical protein